MATRVAGGGSLGPDVQLVEKEDYIILDNGIIQITLSKPGGLITCIRYGGLDNLLEVKNNRNKRGYWDLDWNIPNGDDEFDIVHGTLYQVIDNNLDKVEVSFSRPFDSRRHMVPLNIDKRFVLLRGNTGFYSYATYERPYGWGDFDLNQTRITFVLHKDKFQYMAIADDKQRIMPFPEDRSSSRSQRLIYPEAVKLINPINPSLQGEVDDKYQYSCDNIDNKIHGWISFNPLVGFWIITPSNEFRNGGSTKQDLTSHVGPTCLSMFHSSHYGGTTLCAQFRDGEEWRKVFGPVLIFVNSGSSQASLWEDSKEQMNTEVQAWPYIWPSSPDYAKAEERGSVTGNLIVRDRFATTPESPAALAFLGLAHPGEPGSWQIESKGYQFWVQADASGSFSLSNVRPGDYSLYGWIPGILGDYKYDEIITVLPGATQSLGEIVYSPSRDGPTLWEIGIPDRSAAEFFIPQPNPEYINMLYLNHHERYRQYGLWERYTELYPDTDLVYTIGESDWSKDWFFCHVCRIQSNGSLQPATWQVNFKVDKVIQNSVYKFRMALAAASYAAIQVRFNDKTNNTPLFDTMQFGHDNAIARHGIHGIYWLFNIDVPSNLLADGENSLFLTQRKSSSIFSGVMYDYLRLEEPSSEE